MDYPERELVKKPIKQRRGLADSIAGKRLLRMSPDATDVRQAISLIVAKLLDGVQRRPTDLEALMPRLGVQRIIAEDLPVAGELRRTPDGLTIVHSSDLSAPRKRFTIAHEMGHAVFEASGPRPPREGDEVERICDMIAAEILLPESDFRSAAEGTPSILKLFSIAKQFGTSVHATARRYHQLASVSVFETQGNRINWTVGVFRSLPEDLWTAVRRAQSGTAVDEVMYLGAGTDSRWKVEGRQLGKSERAVFLMSSTKESPKPVSREDLLSLRELFARSTSASPSDRLSEAPRGSGEVDGAGQ
jgi:hypothetical protein